MIGQLSLGFKSFIDFVAENKNHEKCKGKKWQTNRHQTKGFELIDCKLEVTVWARDDRHHFQARMESFSRPSPKLRIIYFQSRVNQTETFNETRALATFLICNNENVGEKHQPLAFFIFLIAFHNSNEVERFPQFKVQLIFMFMLDIAFVLSLTHN